MNTELNIFCLVGLRQVLRFPTENARDEIVRNGITDITRNRILISRTFGELTSSEGRKHLKQLLSSALAEWVGAFGILVNESFGVNIMNRQRKAAFQEALKEESVAKTIGSAAVHRMQPLFEQPGNQDQAKVFIALWKQLASAVAKNSQSPDIIFPTTNDFLAGVGTGINNNSPSDPIRQKIRGCLQNSRPQSLAGD